MQYRGSSRFALVEVQVCEMGRATLLTHPQPHSLWKAWGACQLLPAQHRAFYFMFSFPEQPLHHAPQDSCLLALTVCLPRLGSNQGAQLFLVPIKPFPSQGQQLCLFTSAGMKVEELWLREHSPCLLETCFAQQLVKMHQPVCVSPVWVG